MDAYRAGIIPAILGLFNAVDSCARTASELMNVIRPVQFALSRRVNLLAETGYSCYSSKMLRRLKDCFIGRSRPVLRSRATAEGGRKEAHFSIRATRRIARKSESRHLASYSQVGVLKQALNTLGAWSHGKEVPSKRAAESVLHASRYGHRGNTNRNRRET